MKPAAVVMYARQEPSIVIDLTVFRRINTERRQQRQEGRREDFSTRCDKISAAIAMASAGIAKRGACVNLSSGRAVARVTPLSKRAHRFPLAQSTYWNKLPRLAGFASTMSLC